MNKARDLKHLVLGATLAVSGLSAIAAVNLTTFAPGTPIKSSEVNANFSSLGAAIQALEAPIGISRLAVTGTAADGKVLKLQGGNLAWADDIVGSPGTSYTADGSSLALTGTTFSVKDAGIATSKIADQAVTGAKLAPNSVGLGIIANGSVPDSKLQLPLNLSGRFGNQALVKAFDSGGNGFGLWGESTTGTGVFGRSGNPDFSGIGFDSSGVLGLGQKAGVIGASLAGIGVFGYSQSNYGVYGESQHNNAVFGQTFGTDTSAVGIAGTSDHGFAAYFEAGKLPNGNPAALCTFHAGTTNWACSSDRNLKERFKPVDTARVLEAVSKMPVTTWSMKGSKVRQMGPTAQDFYAAFKLGESDKSINNTDAQGVALAAIKGMYERNKALEAQVKALEARLSALEKAMPSR